MNNKTQVLFQSGICLQVLPPWDCKRVCDGLEIGGGMTRGADVWGDLVPVNSVPERNVVKLFFQCSWVKLASHILNIQLFSINILQRAIIRLRFKTKDQHWLDVANDKFDQQTIDEFKAVYRVGVLFLFYPMYWALFDQQVDTSTY